QPDVFWTHNDSGGGAFIFAVNLKGENLGTWKVAGATNRDWEDIAETKDAAGKCFVYIGEIGNNSLGREEGIVYRIAEPIVTDQTRSTTMSEPQTTANADTLRFSYSDTTHNAETLLVHPVSGDIYIVTKSKSGPAGVYKLKPDFGGDKQTAQKIADISVPAVPDGVITGGDISPDGKRVVLCDYFSGYELSLSADAKDFDNIWKEKPLRFEAGDRDTGESITYTADGQSVIAGSEKKYSPLFQIKRSRQMITGSRLQLWKRPTFRS
ncbi:MAG TPA: hypothetical protein VK612_13760, partial [Pyrinomonadaceae bacterium]|nr:hypothetical protein [Pyrinomonadaceae bacterium]